MIPPILDYFCAGPLSPLRVSLCETVTSPVLDSDCRALGGTASGSCASGFGICCAFTAGCGGRTSTNNTYFLSDGAVSPCSLTVCRAAEDVCQIRWGSVVTSQWSRAFQTLCSDWLG